MPSAKIIFMPKVGSENYPMANVEIVDKYYGWTVSTDDYVEAGYVQTPSATTAANVNNTYWIKLKAKEGYKFKSIYKTDYYGNNNNGEFYPQADGTVFIYPWETGTAYTLTNYLYIELEALEGYVKYKATSNLINCICNNDDEYTENSVVNLTIEATDDYVFNTAPYVVMNEQTYLFEVSNDKKTATLTLTVSGDFTINGVGEVEIKGLTLNLFGCYCTNTNVQKGYNTITLYALNGYEFISNVEVFDDVTGVTTTYNDFTENNTVCIIECDVVGNITITARANLKVNQINSFVHLYNVDDETLSELSKVRFQDDFDYGKYITSLIRLPFEIPVEMLTDDRTIQLGNYDTQILSTAINDYVLNINLGEISVSEKYNNVYDYKDTECILHLPYCEDIKINAEYVINHKLNIFYKIDLYSGNCTVNITSDFTNEIIASKSFSVGAKIPFIQEENNSVVNSLDNILDNGIRTAFIEVVRNKPYDIDTPFGKETVDYGMIGNYTGYIKVSDVVLNVNATADEKTEIENLLKNGICILK